jgi:hypothetical protein
MKSDLECRSEMMCIHVGFCMIVHVIAQNKVSALTPQMYLSPCTRVYIRGVGAALIKKYSSYCKKQNKKSTCFFPKTVAWGPETTPHRWQTLLLS